MPSLDPQDSAFLIDLTHAKRLQTVTLSTLPRLFPFRMAVLFRAILAKLPDGTRIKRFLVNLHEGTEPTIAVRDTWLVLWRGLLAHTSDAHFGLSLDTVVRAQYPCQWDEHLLRGMVPLQESTPVRLEYTTEDGEVRPHVAQQPLK